MVVDDLFEQVARQQAARTARLIGATDEARLRWLLKFAATENFDEMSSSNSSVCEGKFKSLRRYAGASYETVDNPISREAARQLALMVDDGLVLGRAEEAGIFRGCRSPVQSSRTATGLHTTDVGMTRF